MGYYAETTPRGVGHASTAPETSGTIIGIPYWAFAGETIAAIVLENITAGAGGTLVRVGACDLATQTLRCSSADVKVAFQTAGDVTSSMQVPYVIPSDQMMILLFLAVGGTTPALGRYSGISGTAGRAVGAGTAAMAYRQAGQTDIPSPLTMPGNANNNVMYWFGVA